MKRRARYLGLVIGAVGFFFVARELATEWDSVLASARTADSRYLVLSLIVAALGVLTIAIGWHRCLSALGGRVPVRDSLRHYFIGELGKYIPGGVWSVVGRGELARSSGLSRVSSYGATLVSIAIAYLAAVVTAGVTAVMSGAGGDSVSTAAALLLPFALVALHPRAIGLGLNVISRLGRRPIELDPPSWGTSIRLMLFHVPAWIAVGTATWLVALSLDTSVPTLTDIIFAAVISWVVGLLAVPVPGGIGVREAVFVALATSVTSAGVAAAIAITSRVVFVLVDAGGALVVSLIAGRRASRST